MEQQMLLGEGSYGCVFSPKIKCTEKEQPIRNKTKADSKKHFVGKVFSDSQEFLKEVSMSKKVATIDPKGETILVPTATCKTTRKEVIRNIASKDCEMIRDSTSHDPNQRMYQLIMPYGGTRFDRYFRNKMDTGTPDTLHAFINVLRPVFQGLVLLEKHKMCHQDIKSSNILVTPQNQAILIDYSLMTPFDSIYSSKNIRRLRFTYFPYPPEYKIATLIYNGCKMECPVGEETLRNILQFGDSRANAFHTFMNREDVVKHVQSLMSYLYKTGVAVPTGKQNIFTWLRTYANRIDMYGLGTAIVDASRYITIPSKHNSQWKEFVRGLIHPDVRKRFAPKKALDELRKLERMLSK